jgi:hypothetical protein
LTVVSPEVFPPVETPIERACAAPPERVTVVAPAAVACEAVMSPDPTITNLDPVETAVLPAVFPPVETPMERAWAVPVPPVPPPPFLERMTGVI